jgi:hypothetical protein
MKGIPSLLPSDAFVSITYMRGIATAGHNRSRQCAEGRPDICGRCIHAQLLCCFTMYACPASFLRLSHFHGGEFQGEHARCTQAPHVIMQSKSWSNLAWLSAYCGICANIQERTSVVHDEAMRPVVDSKPVVDSNRCLTWYPSKTQSGDCPQVSGPQFYPKTTVDGIQLMLFTGEHAAWFSRCEPDCAFRCVAILVRTPLPRKRSGYNVTSCTVKGNLQILNQQWMHMCRRLVRSLVKNA